MGRTAVFVMGPAGSGKSSFSTSLQTLLHDRGRPCSLINLDPAADSFHHPPTIDIRDLISLADVMEELELGPNGGLLYCFEFLMDNLDWFDDEIGDFENDYLLLDMPGQIELYTHIPLLPSLARYLDQKGIRVCAVYLLEAPFIVDKFKFFSGVMSALAAMVMLEVPHVNVLSKIDLVRDEVSRTQLRRFLDPDPLLMNEVGDGEKSNERFGELSRAIVGLIDDFHMVSFLECSVRDEESVKRVLSYIDDCTQWAEDQEPMMKEGPEGDEGHGSD